MKTILSNSVSGKERINRGSNRRLFVVYLLFVSSF